MPLWQVRLRLPESDRRSQLRELRRRPGMVIRGVDERDVTVEVDGADEAHVRRDWTDATVLTVFRVDGGWSGDWWDGMELEVMDSEYELGPADEGAGTGVLVAVPFHHFDVHGDGRRLTLFWNGYASCRPGPATADERDDGVIVTVTERRPRGPLATAGEGRRSTVELRAPLGDRAIWDRALTPNRAASERPGRRRACAAWRSSSTSPLPRAHPSE
jgi:hypothetical protein